MAERVTVFAPGRVNLIGEHTDYNEGLALPFAVGDGVTVQATRSPARRLEARAVDFEEEDSFELDAVEPADGWRAYVRGAAAELERRGSRLTGARLRIEGTIPQGAGLSSSAALEVSVALALLAVSESGPMDRTELARLCSLVENEWAGAQTGLLDQMASLYGEEKRALRIDFRTLAVTPVALELGEWRLVTLDSGEQHSNAASGYNERRAECARACAMLGVESLRDVTLEEAEELPEPLQSRVRHVVTENTRVDETIEALRAGNLPQVGELLDRSHASLRDDYEISTPSVEATIRRLKDAGAAGARIMGGGFGGHVLGLLAPDTEPPEGAIEVRPGGGARRLAGRA